MRTILGRSHGVSADCDRRGSTLVIVTALLGLLSFLGVMFFFFSSQERAASESFSEAAKHVVEHPDDVFDHLLRQVIVGASDHPSERGSILRSANQRHSLVGNLLGEDIHPHTGTGVRIGYGADGVPFEDQDADGVSDREAEPALDWLEFVDSPSARAHAGYVERGFEQRRGPALPAADVDYTYPDLNNAFLAYRGTAIRDNGAGAVPRFEQVPVVIPSFFRPQYLKRGPGNGPGGSDVLTDRDWAMTFDGTTSGRKRVPYAARSFRPHPGHIAGRLPDGSVVYRYVSEAEARSLRLSGGFPFQPEEATNNAGNDPQVRGELGIWTGSHPSVYELDADNDGDGLKEGIWLDLHFPIQQTASGKEYAVLHSVTIYDLDSLIDLNAHGNLAGLDRLGELRAAQPMAIRDGMMHNQFVSRSNQGHGPNEVNPLWALRRSDALPRLQSAGYRNLRTQFEQHFGRLPATDLEQANLEWIWLLAGRAAYETGTARLENIFTGRWGEADLVYRAFGPNGSRRVYDLPRPGGSGNFDELIGTGIRFGGEYSNAFSPNTGRAVAGWGGYDDNQDALEDIPLPLRMALADPLVDDHTQVSLSWSVHPMDYSGVGRTTTAIWGGYDGHGFSAIEGSPRKADIVRWRYHDVWGPYSHGYWQDRVGFLRYHGYNINNWLAAHNAIDEPSYAGWQHLDPYLLDHPEKILNSQPVADGLFEDPLETLIDHERAQRHLDNIFGPQDVFGLQLSADDLRRAPELSRRPLQLAPFAFEAVPENEVRERFTTLSNSFRHFPLQHDLGPDLRPGTQDDGPRSWEFSADTNQTGYGNEFPPAFGDTRENGLPYSSTDPFRPEVRRLLTIEAGAQRTQPGNFPLSINHILDVSSAGLHFRPLTQHPLPGEHEGNTLNPIVSLRSVPRYDPEHPVAFPPVTTAEREFWARRDRQQFCRDIFVLLYTLGGAQRDSVDGKRIADYSRLPNDPTATEGLIDSTGKSGSCLYSHAQLREMAQFAVNLVDAMDPDDIMTKFEYDKNLGPDLVNPHIGGWNLDDDPFTAESAAIPESDSRFEKVTDRGRYREDSLTRGVVYGIEQADFRISEVLAVDAVPAADKQDHPATLHDESKGRQYLFVELSEESGSGWYRGDNVMRLARFDRRNKAEPIGGRGNDGRPFRAVEIGTNAWNGSVISTASDASLISSDLFIDYNGDKTFELVAPRDDLHDNLPLPTTQSDPTDPEAKEFFSRCHVDLVRDFFDGPGEGDVLDVEFRVVDAMGIPIDRPGAFLDDLRPYRGNDPLEQQGGGLYPDDGVTGFDLVLQLKMNPYAVSLNSSGSRGEDLNPWVDVDVFRVEFRELKIESTDTAEDIMLKRLPKICSFERDSILDASSRMECPGLPGTAFIRNSLHFSPGLTGGLATPWFAHFNRSFANLGELFSVPIRGPETFTAYFTRINQSPASQTRIPQSSRISPQFAASAAARFLLPDFPDDPELTTAENEARDNRWYRLLQFIEVPSRVNRMAGHYLDLKRLPGKLNLNTIRHWEVYAGLIDNPIILDRMPRHGEFGRSNPLGLITQDRTPDDSGRTPTQPRDRWMEYLQERDGAFQPGFDPRPGIRAPRRFLVPGSPSAAPFHSLAWRAPLDPAGSGDNGIDGTVLRTLRADRLDAQPQSNRHWLEVASAEQHDGSAETPLMHQHQILSKILANTTTVSNTFVVFASAGYFEAVEQKLPDGEGSGIYRIGSRINIDAEKSLDDHQNPGWEQRGVFVIDRTEALRAWDPGTREIDWRRLVRSRATLQ